MSGLQLWTSWSQRLEIQGKMKLLLQVATEIGQGCRSIPNVRDFWKNVNQSPQAWLDSHLPSMWYNSVLENGPNSIEHYSKWAEGCPFQNTSWDPGSPWFWLLHFLAHPIQRQYETRRTPQEKQLETRRTFTTTSTNLRLLSHSWIEQGARERGERDTGVQQPLIWCSAVTRGAEAAHLFPYLWEAAACSSLTESHHAWQLPTRTQAHPSTTM